MGSAPKLLLNLRLKSLAGSRRLRGGARSCMLNINPRRTGRQSLRERLAGLGLGGLVAYGLLNTVYYTFAFFLVWRYVARVPRGAPP